MFPSNRRTQLLIEPYRQLRFGLMFILINFVFSTLVLLVFGYFLWDIFEAMMEYFKLDKAQEMVAASKFVAPVSGGLILVALFIFVTLYISARYTHQIYGPLVSIRRFLDELLAGKTPPRIKLRTRDQLHDLVDRLNNISDLLSVAQTKGSMGSILNFVENLTKGKEQAALSLSEDDPLRPLSLKLNELARQSKKS